MNGRNDYHIWALIGIWTSWHNAINTQLRDCLNRCYKDGPRGGAVTWFMTSPSSFHTLCQSFLQPVHRDYYLGRARPVRSSGGMGSVSVSTGRNVAMVNIPLITRKIKEKLTSWSRQPCKHFVQINFKYQRKIENNGVKHIPPKNWLVFLSQKK